jgi:hypothetical protein
MTCTKPHSSHLLLLILNKLAKMQTFNNECYTRCVLSAEYSHIFFLRLGFPTKVHKTRVVWQVDTNVLRKLAALIVFVPWKWDQGIPFKCAYTSTKLHNRSSQKKIILMKYACLK